MTSVPKISIDCGPADDTRTFSLELPLLYPKLGVLVSGGLDSAFLYYMVSLLANEKYTVTPYTITRNDGSNIYAQKVIDYVNGFLNKEPQLTTFVPIKERNSDLQVFAGLKELKFQSHIYFIGLIETLPEHAIGVPTPWVPVDGVRAKFPMKNLNKSHVVDLVNKFNITELFKITHSCVYPIDRCGGCNRCNERHWAFTKLGLVDPGTS